ncbi:MAG: tRNA pseudouridine(38-40) synthase TruA [Pontimonas sp.]
MRLRVDLAYDGAGFSGWAKQPNLPSVQQTLETALAKALRLDLSLVRTVVAGRTDSGVHATGQVCHVDLPSDHALVAEPHKVDKELLKRLRGALGKTSAIWVERVMIAPDGFDARFSPLRRRYEYRIADGRARKDPRTAGHTLWISDSLNQAAMNRLGKALLGLHDWASFCRAREGATTIRTLEKFSWVRDSEGVLCGTVVADAFCHSMVRSLVGAAIAVGKGDLDVSEIVALRDQTARTSAWKTMPAHGLTLVEVIYPKDRELARRAELTRAQRTPLSD